MDKTEEIKFSEKKKLSKKNKYICIVLVLMFVSNATLRNQEHLKIYIGISLIVYMYAFFKGILNPSRFSKVIVNGYFTWLFILFFMYFFYGIFLTKYGYFNADYFFFMFSMTFATLLLLVDMHYKILIEIFIKVCAYASIVICIYIVINEWSLIITGSSRIGESGSGNVNTVATYLGTMSIPLIYKVIFDKKYKYAIPYGLSIGIMLLTGSKKSLVFIIMGFSLIFIFKNRLQLHKYILLLIIIVGLFILIFNNEYLYNIIGHRIIDFIGSLGFRIEGANYSYSTEIRLVMYKVGFDAFLSKPLFGGGWFYFSFYSGLGTYSHCNYLEILVTYGIVGFLIYYGIFAKELIELKKLSKVNDYAKLLFTMLTVILVNDIVEITYIYNIMYYQILGLVYLFIKSLKKEIQNDDCNKLQANHKE